ncbi:hypothetical protein DPEC_G00186910 [Dallia pectoralis]|uniref:Uncharacterized protein n=1 Tax=Dallia pectoralis TaxID=75939 RepID=A0ACC2GBU1_DALPE|nr:hypothetical protein DPEC_G00186910 [Dallia pectoralis]
MITSPICRDPRGAPHYYKATRGAVGEEMPEQMKMLLVIVFAALTYKVTSEEIQMDMALNAVDDQYFQCQDEMLANVLGLLEKEQKDSTEYKNALENAQDCKQIIPGGVREHTTALRIYGSGYPKFLKKFNNAVATQGANVSDYESFPFKSLHFLLMDAMRLLKTGKCQTVFHGSDKRYTAQVGSEVRFGMFISANERINEPKEYAITNDGTVFNITSCTVVNIDNNLCEQEYNEMFISPAEVFQVTEVKEKVVRANEKYKEIVLTSLRTFSNNNCLLFPRPTPASTTPSTGPRGISPQQFTSNISKLVTMSLAISLFTRTK